MTLQTASDIWRKYETANVPGSGVHQPVKSEIVEWGTFLETFSNLGAGFAFVSLAAANADLLHIPSTLSIVYGDATAANNGLYSKAGASGAGSWTRIGDLPTSLVRVTVTGGTANAIVATAPETPQLPGSKLYLMTPASDTTGASTLALNGQAAAPIKSSLGDDTVAHSLIANSQVLMAWAVDHYQLLISVPVDASGILASAISARDLASGYATSASTSASALGNQVHQYDTRTLAIAATIPSGVGLLRTFGYAAAGDGGAATYKKVGSQPTHADKLQSADGAWWQIVTDGGALYPEMFGAKGDGSTDDTTALQNCITATAIGGTIRNAKPAAHYLVSSTINVSEPISMKFSTGCAIVPASGLGSGDVIKFSGSANGLAYSTIIENVQIGDPASATRYGGVGIRFDTTASGVYFRGLQMRGVYVSAGTLSRYGVIMLNDPAQNANGGIFTSTIEGGVIQGGLLVSGCGDNITIRDTLIPHNFGASADNLGILVSLATGAGSFVIDHINFSQAGGVIMDACYASTIQNSQFEAQATITADAVVYIRAGDATIGGFKFINNQAQANSGIGTPLFLKISSNVGHIIVSGNAFATPTSYTAVTNASAALQQGPNFWSTGSPHISGTAPANTYGGG